MSAPLSVIIPTVNAAQIIGPNLAVLANAMPEGLIREIIISDGGSSDDTLEIADLTGAKIVIAQCGRGPQLAAGARAAQGSWLLFLHADCVLSPGWVQAVNTHIQRWPHYAGYFRLAFDSDRTIARWVAGWANLRSALFALPYGDQGLLISQPLYKRVGGYPLIPLMEDVALIRKIGRSRIRPIQATATTSAERYEREGWIPRGRRNLGTLLRFYMGVPPEKLVDRYYRN